jgi:hypothetical protein
MGDHRVKNIPEPVTVYRVITEPGPIARTFGLERAATRPWRVGALTAAIVLLVVAGGAGLWLRSDDGAPPPSEQALTPATTSTSPALAPQAPFNKTASRCYHSLTSAPIPKTSISPTA